MPGRAHPARAAARIRRAAGAGARHEVMSTLGGEPASSDTSTYVRGRSEKRTAAVGTRAGESAPHPARSPAVQAATAATVSARPRHPRRDTVTAPASAPTKCRALGAREGEAVELAAAFLRLDRRPGTRLECGVAEGEEGVVVRHPPQVGLRHRHVTMPEVVRGVLGPAGARDRVTTLKHAVAGRADLRDL